MKLHPWKTALVALALMAVTAATAAPPNYMDAAPYRVWSVTLETASGVKDRVVVDWGDPYFRQPMDEDLLASLERECAEAHGEAEPCTVIFVLETRPVR